MCVILANSYTIGKNFKLVNGKIYTVFKKFSGHTDTTKCFQMCQKIVKNQYWKIAGVPNFSKLCPCFVFIIGKAATLIIFKISYSTKCLLTYNCKK